MKVERIISSPYTRAIQTIQPLANQLNIEIEINNQLAERSLSSIPFSDWFEKLRATFEDFHLKYEGGESSQEATGRIVSVVNTVINEGGENTIIVTHGNIMALLLNFYNKEFGFEDWE
ncbi:histidine phosphatase family protein [Virgibacillus pantothenticus]|uniref:histidine phosphatase family protein n=1 Tax=Virgibacillus pantothenticus TaxID=1473 RepID=UPI002E21E9FE